MNASERPSNGSGGGVIVAVIAALCCVVPILYVVVGSVGVGWLVGRLPYLLFPALFVLLGLVARWGWHKRQKIECNKGNCPIR